MRIGTKPLSLLLALAFVCSLFATARAEVTLKFATQNAENAWSTVNGLIPWIKKVEQESQGTLKIDLYANQTLAKGPQVWMAVKNGIADMAWVPMGMYAGLNPLMEVVGLGGLAYDNALDGTRLVWDTYENVPATRKPYEPNKILALYTTDTGILLTKTPVRSLEDIKGKKIRCTAGAYVNLLNAWGATPVVMPMPDVYMSLQKGTIDGLICDWESLIGFRFYDVAKFITTNVPMGSVIFCITMNPEKFAALPPEAQKAIEANSGREGSMWLAKYFSYDSRSLADTPEVKNNVTMFALSPEDRQRWTTPISEPLWNKWLGEINAKGISDGPAVLKIMTGK